MSKKYYVYCAYGVNNEILYIGKVVVIGINIVIMVLQPTKT